MPRIVLNPSDTPDIRDSLTQYEKPRRLYAHERKPGRLRAHGFLPGAVAGWARYCAAMARKHVELHYRGFDAVNRRDLDAYLALMRGDVVVNSRLVAVEGIYQGHDGVRRWWADLLEVLPDFSAEASEIRDLGDVTLAVTCVRGHGAGSDVPIELTLFQVAEWHDEKVTRWSAYLSEAEALAAAGSR